LQALSLRDYPFTRGLSKWTLTLQAQSIERVLVRRKGFNRHPVTGQVSVECFDMPDSQESKRIEIEERLREVTQRLRSEMVARGFDPEQGDNVALTAPLAKLYLERENLQAELDSLDGGRPETEGN
jgi:hypothetical protein